jgi:hypothetical protein
MKVVATADTHGRLPEIPECDLYIMGGDVCPLISDRDLPVSASWLKKKFMPYLEQVPAKEVVWLAGNHDFVLEHYPWVTNELCRGPVKESGRIHYLQDDCIWLNGLKVHGTPRTPGLPSWAFPADGKEAEAIFAGIPSDLDILVAHSPPYGYSDRISYARHVGCSELLARCKVVKPKVIITGHIHEGFGEYETSWGGKLYNVAHNNEYYEPVNAPIEITVEPAQ